MITALYYTKNEGEFLHQSLLSVEEHVDEIIVYDAQSTDETHSICANHPKVNLVIDGGHFLGTGEKAVREKGMALCHEPWVLIVDGDEVMGNHWYETVQPHLETAGAIALSRWEHQGSYEYVWMNGPERQVRMFRRHPGLVYTPSSYPPHQIYGSHGTFDNTALQPVVEALEPVSIFHYGMCRRNMKQKFLRNITRRDHEGDPEDHIAKLDELGPLAFIPPVRSVPYPIEDVPHSMRPLFGKTYRVELDPNGKITKREKL